MELKKSKVFTHKLIALFLAALLVISTFTGVMTVFAKSRDGYNDDKLAANFLAWAETTDNQTAEALLDYADLYLPQLMSGLDLGDIKPRGTTRINFSYDVPVIGTIAIRGYVDSVDGVLDLIRFVQEDVLNKKVLGQSLKNWAGGDIQNIDLTAVYDLNTSTTDGVVSKCGVAYRSQNDAKKIIITIAKLLYVHANTYGGKNVLNQFITGNLNLGLIGNFLDMWSLLKDPLNMWDNYQTNLVYNIVANLIWENTNWYSESEIEVFKQAFVNNGKDQKVWDFDNELFGKLTSELLQLINVQVTYSNKVPKIELDQNSENYGQIVKDDDGETVYEKDNSKRRWFLINGYMKNNGLSYEAAVEAVNENEGAQLGFYCDPNLRYKMNEDGSSDGNILLFTYGDKTLEVKKTDSANTIAFNAAEIAWQTVLEPTIGLLEIDYDRKVDSEIFANQVANFDRSYYAWKAAHSGWAKSDTNANKWKENYSAASVEAWAAAVYDDYEYKDGVTPSAENFLKGVKETLVIDRTRAEDPKNNWRDIDATKLFVELRYSPLADIYFDIQTGPINLYFAETGAFNIKSFFKTAFTEYSSIPSALNNALVAAVKDFFLESDNIGMTVDGEYVSLARPALATTTGVDSQNIASTLVSNAAHVFEYAANAADENILGAFYANHPTAVATASNSLSEANFEEAALPMGIAVLKQWNMTDVIHDDEWDTCVDAEGAAVIALAEYLSYVIPDKDYSPLYKVEDGALVVSGNYDINEDGKHDLFNDVLMPMARDAVGYLLQSVVTVRKDDGTEWSVYTSDPLTDHTTIFTLLNSVLCYYASTDEFENSDGAGTSTITGKGAAALLGCVDSNGKCTVTFSKTLWQNIDTIANTLLPVIGSLQNGTYGGASSYDLIYTKVIEGLLEISANGGGITNLIKQVIDIVDSTPTKVGADVALYDYVVAPTVNAVFGAKYSGQSLNVIPTSASYFANDSSSNTDAASPFNALIHVDTLGGFNDMGVLSTLISNLVEAFGVNDYWSKSGDRWQGAMFAVKAVNNFIPSFVPQLSDHSFGPVTAKVDVPSYSGMSGNQSIGTGNYLTITNTAIGLNRFYRPGPGQKVQRESRYFAEIKDAEIINDDGFTNIYLSGDASGVLSPGESLKIPVLGSTLSKADTYVYKVAVTYNMFEGETQNGSKPSANGNYIFPSDITTYCYIVITQGGSWQSALYPDTRAVKDGDNIVKYQYANASYSNNSAGGKSGSGDARTLNTNSGGQDNNLIGSVPETMVISSDNPSIVDKYTVRVRNNNSGSSRKYYGAVAFITEGTQYYAVDGEDVDEELTEMEDNETSDMAYAYIDSEGNLLNRDFYDYRIDEGEWVGGYDRETLDEMEENGSLKDDFNAGRITERTHVSYTFDEALAEGIVTGVQRTENADGSYTYQNVFVNPTTDLVKYDSSAITFVTPFSGFYFQNNGLRNVESQSNNFDYFIAYDGSGVTASKDAYTFNVAFIPESGRRMIISSEVYIADQSDQYSLTEATQEEITKMASYRPSDFVDYDEATDTSENYNAIIDAMTAANKLAATALSVDAASTISSTKITQAATSETTNHGGDRAYVPATEAQIPSSVLSGAYQEEGIFYLNKECTMPIYSNVALTDEDVVDLVAGNPATGKDAAGQEVVKYGGVWYLANEVEYSYEWDTETYWTVDPDDEEQMIGAPYYGPVKDEDHIVKWGDSTVYLQKQFVYRDADGNKVNSDDKYDNGNYKWTVKFAAGETVIKPNEEDIDYRGSYQQGIDTLNYYNSIFSKILKPVGAQSVANEVTAVRSVDSNSVNYDVATYEKMVQVAREAENLIWYEDATDAEGNYIYNEDGSRKQTPVTDRSSMEIEMAVNRFQAYFERAQAQSRGYIGGRLEAEISAHHAIGGSYANFTATKTGETIRFEYSTKGADEEDNVDVYTVSVAEGTTLGFGTRAADGTLANADADGNKLYTDASWAAYVNALGAAVEAATGQSAKVSEVYTAKSHLVMAENNLEPFTGEEGEDNTKFTVTGKITIAEDREGTSGKYGIGGIKLMMGDEVVGESAADGTFEIKVPKGTPVGLTITGDTTVNRNITINGDADVTGINIPMVVCNYESSDNLIDATDAGLFLGYIGTSNAYANLEASDSKVDATDAGLFLGFIGKTAVSYADWSQTDYVLE